ncbi:MAG: hypothetical protein EXX96DRAFT_570460 [Benjaminiella poitrasii]|nr:MAG: hypothetical protein EXX96DRAFT_570460 [Benjaminiella poitrasii]
MACNIEDDVPNGSMLQVDSPEPSLLKVEILDPERNYQTQSWKNGLGKTSEISIYPPEKDFRKDSFFWRLSENVIEADFNYPILLGYEYTNIILPSEERKSTIQLNHRGEENSSSIKPLFPYSWNAEWATSCKVTDAPLTCLQFLIKRELGTAQFSLDKLDQLISNESGETGRKLVLGAFALIYVIEGHVRIGLDENSPQGTHRVLSAGQTLYVERDEDASPTSMTIQPSDASGGISSRDSDATIVTIQITETKKKGAPSTLGTNISDYGGGVQLNTAPLINSLSPSSANDTAMTISTSPIQQNYASGGEDAPSRRREPRRKGSLVVYDDQPFWNLPQDVAQRIVAQEANASAAAIPVSSDNIGGELAATLKRDTEPTAANNNKTRTMKPGIERRNSIAILRDKLETTQIYEPPTFSDLNQDTDVPPPVVRDRLVIEDFPKHTISTAWIKMVKQGLSEWMRLPVIVCRGSEEGPVVGITAAVHGNELNGVPCIHRVVSEIDVRHLRGTVVAVPCVNVSGYLKFTRDFADGRDLNRLFPGREDGFASQVYCYQLMNRVISQFNYLIDLHTASFGRVNSYYVRADMNDPFSATMARLQQPQIVLHNSGQDGTLRSAASARGIRAITVEIGNPQLFQSQYVQWSYVGVMRILDHLKMYNLNDQSAEDILALGPPNTILCSKGFWIYTKTGGVLEVYPGVNTIVQKGDLIARMKNIFGNVVDEYHAPCSGIVIGRSSNPVAMSGDRIIHLGVIKKKNESLPKEAKENY